MVTTYSYDLLNRLTTTSYGGTQAILRCYDGTVPNATLSACVSAVPAVALAVGKLTGTGNSSSTTKYLGFDAFGRVLSSSQTTVGNADPFGFSYTYTASGGLNTITY